VRQLRLDLGLQLEHRRERAGAAESLAFFLSRAEHAAAFPILEGLLGGFHRLLLAG
jgi:hypothetical protein